MFTHLLRVLLDALAKRLQLVVAEPVIDCDTSPFVPEGYEILPDAEQLPNRIRGSFKWDPSKVRLHLDMYQEVAIIGGHELRKKLEDQPVLPANVLDFLLAHTELIPYPWEKEKRVDRRKDKSGITIHFWGTLYRDVHGKLYVRFLYWDGFKWRSDCGPLDYKEFGSRNPAAVLV